LNFQKQYFFYFIIEHSENSVKMVLSLRLDLLLARCLNKINPMSELLENYFEQGLAQLDAGDYTAAIQLFDKALRLSLGNLAEVHLYRGEAHAYLQNWDEAMADFNAALRYDPHLPEVYNERGNLRRFLGDLAGAIEDQTRAIQLNPQHTEAYYNRALAYEAQNRIQAAVDDLTRALTLDSSLALAYEVRGRLRVQLYDFDGAIDDLTRYLRMGGGREYDNHSEVQSQLINLRLSRFWRNLFRLGKRQRQSE